MHVRPLDLIGKTSPLFSGSISVFVLLSTAYWTSHHFNRHTALMKPHATRPKHRRDCGTAYMSRGFVRPWRSLGSCWACDDYTVLLLVVACMTVGEVKSDSFLFLCRSVYAHGKPWFVKAAYICAALHVLMTHQVVVRNSAIMVLEPCSWQRNSDYWYNIQ